MIEKVAALKSRKHNVKLILCQIHFMHCIYGGRIFLHWHIWSVLKYVISTHCKKLLNYASSPQCATCIISLASLPNPRNFIILYSNNSIRGRGNAKYSLDNKILNQNLINADTNLLYRIMKLEGIFQNIVWQIKKVTWK